MILLARPRNAILSHLSFPHPNIPFKSKPSNFSTSCQPFQTFYPTFSMFLKQKRLHGFLTQESFLHFILLFKPQHLTNFRAVFSNFPSFVNTCLRVPKEQGTWFLSPPWPVYVQGFLFGVVQQFALMLASAFKTSCFCLEGVSNLGNLANLGSWQVKWGVLSNGRFRKDCL